MHRCKESCGLDLLQLHAYGSLVETCIPRGPRAPEGLTTDLILNPRLCVPSLAGSPSPSSASASFATACQPPPLKPLEGQKQKTPAIFGRGSRAVPGSSHSTTCSDVHSNEENDSFFALSATDSAAAAACLATPLFPTHPEEGGDTSRQDAGKRVPRPLHAPPSAERPTPSAAHDSVLCPAKASEDAATFVLLAGNALARADLRQGEAETSVASSEKVLQLTSNAACVTPQRAGIKTGAVGGEEEDENPIQRDGSRSEAEERRGPESDPPAERETADSAGAEQEEREKGEDQADEIKRANDRHGEEVKVERSTTHGEAHQRDAPTPEAKQQNADAAKQRASAGKPRGEAVAEAAEERRDKECGQSVGAGTSGEADEGRKAEASADTEQKPEQLKKAEATGEAHRRAGAAAGNAAADTQEEENSVETDAQGETLESGGEPTERDSAPLPSARPLADVPTCPLSQFNTGCSGDTLFPPLGSRPDKATAPNHAGAALQSATTSCVLPEEDCEAPQPPRAMGAQSSTGLRETELNRASETGAAGVGADCDKSRRLLSSAEDHAAGALSTGEAPRGPSRPEGSDAVDRVEDGTKGEGEGTCRDNGDAEKGSFDGCALSFEEGSAPAQAPRDGGIVSLSPDSGCGDKRDSFESYSAAKDASSLFQTHGQASEAGCLRGCPAREGLRGAAEMEDAALHHQEAPCGLYSEDCLSGKAGNNGVRERLAGEAECQRALVDAEDAFASFCEESQARFRAKEHEGEMRFLSELMRDASRLASPSRREPLGLPRGSSESLLKYPEAPPRGRGGGSSQAFRQDAREAVAQIEPAENRQTRGGVERRQIRSDRETFRTERSQPAACHAEEESRLRLHQTSAEEDVSKGPVHRTVRAPYGFATLDSFVSSSRQLPSPEQAPPSGAAPDVSSASLSSASPRSSAFSALLSTGFAKHLTSLRPCAACFAELFLLGRSPLEMAIHCRIQREHLLQPNVSQRLLSSPLVSPNSCEGVGEIHAEDEAAVLQRGGSAGGGLPRHCHPRKGVYSGSFGAFSVFAASSGPFKSAWPLALASAHDAFPAPSSSLFPRLSHLSFRHLPPDLPPSASPSCPSPEAATRPASREASLRAATELAMQAAAESGSALWLVEGEREFQWRCRERKLFNAFLQNNKRRCLPRDEFPSSHELAGQQGWAASHVDHRAKAAAGGRLSRCFLKQEEGFFSLCKDPQGWTGSETPAEASIHHRRSPESKRADDLRHSGGELEPLDCFRCGHACPTPLHSRGRASPSKGGGEAGECRRAARREGEVARRQALLATACGFRQRGNGNSEEGPVTQFGFDASRPNPPPQRPSRFGEAPAWLSLQWEARTLEQRGVPPQLARGPALRGSFDFEQDAEAGDDEDDKQINESEAEEDEEAWTECRERERIRETIQTLYRAFEESERENAELRRQLAARQTARSAAPANQGAVASASNFETGTAVGDAETASHADADTENETRKKRRRKQIRGGAAGWFDEGYRSAYSATSPRPAYAAVVADSGTPERTDFPQPLVSSPAPSQAFPRSDRHFVSSSSASPSLLAAASSSPRPSRWGSPATLCDGERPLGALRGAECEVAARVSVAKGAHALLLGPVVQTAQSASFAESSSDPSASRASSSSPLSRTSADEEERERMNELFKPHVWLEDDAAAPPGGGDKLLKTPAVRRISKTVSECLPTLAQANAALEDAERERRATARLSELPGRRQHRRHLRGGRHSRFSRLHGSFATRRRANDGPDSAAASPGSSVSASLEGADTGPVTRQAGRMRRRNSRTDVKSEAEGARQPLCLGSPASGLVFSEEDDAEEVNRLEREKPRSDGQGEKKGPETPAGKREETGGPQGGADRPQRDVAPDNAPLEADETRNAGCDPCGSEEPRSTDEGRRSSGKALWVMQKRQQLELRGAPSPEKNAEKGDARIGREGCAGGQDKKEGADRPAGDAGGAATREYRARVKGEKSRQTLREESLREREEEMQKARDYQHLLRLLTAEAKTLRPWREGITWSKTQGRWIVKAPSARSRFPARAFVPHTVDEVAATLASACEYLDQSRRFSRRSSAAARRPLWPLGATRAPLSPSGAHALKGPAAAEPHAGGAAGERGDSEGLQGDNAALEKESRTREGKCHPDAEAEDGRNAGEEETQNQNDHFEEGGVPPEAHLFRGKNTHKTTRSRGTGQPAELKYALGDRGEAPRVGEERDIRAHQTPKGTPALAQGQEMAVVGGEDEARFLTSAELDAVADKLRPLKYPMTYWLKGQRAFTVKIFKFEKIRLDSPPAGAASHAPSTPIQASCASLEAAPPAGTREGQEARKAKDAQSQPWRPEAQARDANRSDEAGGLDRLKEDPLQGDSRAGCAEGEEWTTRRAELRGSLGSLQKSSSSSAMFLLRNKQYTGCQRFALRENTLKCFYEAYEEACAYAASIGYPPTAAVVRAGPGGAFRLPRASEATSGLSEAKTADTLGEPPRTPQDSVAENAAPTAPPPEEEHAAGADPREASRSSQAGERGAEGEGAGERGHSAQAETRGRGTAEKGEGKKDGLDQGRRRGRASPGEHKHAADEAADRSGEPPRGGEEVEANGALSQAAAVEDAIPARRRRGRVKREKAREEDEEEDALLVDFIVKRRAMRCTQGSNSDTAKHAEAPPHAGLEAEREESKIMCAYRKRKPKAGPWRLRRAARAGDPSSARSDAADDRRAEDLHSIPESAVAPGDEREALGSEVARHGMHIAEDSKAARAQRRPWPRPRGGSRRELAVLALAGGRSERLTRQRRTDTGEASGAAAETPASLDAADTSTEVGSGEREASAPRQDSEPEGVAADRETTPAAHASDRGGQDGVPTSQEEERKEEAIGRRSSRKRGRRFQVADTEDEESVSQTSSRVNRELASGSEEKVQAAAAPGAEIERTRYSYDAASATGDTEAEVKLHTTEAEEVTQSDEFASATVGCAPEETTKPTLQATEAPKREGIQHESKGVPKTKSTKLRHPATAAPSLDASSGHGRRKERHLEAREDVLEKEGGGGGAAESIRSPGMCLRSSEEKAQDQQANAAGESLTVAAAERTRDAKEEAADGDARGDCQTRSRTAAKNKPSSPLQPPDFSPSSVALEAPRADGLSLVFLPGLPSSPVEAGSDPARSSKRQQACETRSLEVASGDNRDASAFTPVAMLNTSSRLASVAATGLAPAGDQSCEASHLGSSAPPSETVLSLALGKVRAAEREREDKGDDREAKSAKKDEADSPVNEREAAAPGGDAPVDGRLQDGCRREARGTAQDYTEMMTQRAGEAGDDTRRNMASASAAASSDAPEGEPDRRQGRQQTDRTQETHARERDEAREGEAGGSRIETLAYCCLGSPPPLQPLLSQRLWSVSAFLQRRGDKSEGRDKVKQNALPLAPRALTATPLSCLTQRLYTRLPSAAEARGRSRASPPSARKGEPSSDSSGEREGTKETSASPEEKGGARQATAESRESKCVEFEGAKYCIEESHFARGRGGRYDRQERGYKEKAVTEEREVFDGNKDRTGHDPDNRHSSLTRSPYEGAAADSRNRSLPPRRTSVDSRHAFPRRHRALGRRDLFREEERRPRRAWSSRSESSSRSASTQPPGRREYFDRGSSSSPDARRHRSRDRSRELRGSRETSSDRSPKRERHSAEGGSVWGEERGSSSASRRRGCGGREPVGRPSTERHTHPEHRRERRKTDAERDRSRGSSQPFRRRSHHETQFCRRRDDTQREAWAHSRDASEKDSPSRTGRGQRSRSRDGASHRRRRGSYRERRCDGRESDAGQRDSGGGTARTGARSRGRPFAEDIQFSPETRSLQNDARMPATTRASERGASERHRDRNLTRPLVWLGSRKHSRERSPESRRGAYSHSPVHRHSGGRVQVRGHPSSRQRQARPERWSEECEECDERGAPRSEVLPCESVATRRRSSHDSLGAGRTCVGEATANADSEPEPTRSRGHSRYSKRKGESLGSTGEGRGRRSARERSDVRGWILGATCPDPEQTLHSRAPERLEGNRGDSDPHSRPQDGRAAARSSHPPARDIFTAFQIKGTPLAKARRLWEAGEMPKIKVSLLTRKPQAAPNRDDAVQP